MADPFIGQIMPVAFPFAPWGWALCNGSILYIQQNQALYSIIGNRYGGNGAYSFALPDLQGRIPIGWGQGPESTSYEWGTTGGKETVTLLENNVMEHTHPVMANDAANQLSPEGMIWGGDPLGANPRYSNTAPTKSEVLSGTALGPAGGLNGKTQPHDNLPPIVGLYYIIALDGLYPSRQD